MQLTEKQIADHILQINSFFNFIKQNFCMEEGYTFKDGSLYSKSDDSIHEANPGGKKIADFWNHEGNWAINERIKSIDGNSYPLTKIKTYLEYSAPIIKTDQNLKEFDQVIIVRSDWDSNRVDKTIFRKAQWNWHDQWLEIYEPLIDYTFETCATNPFLEISDRPHLYDMIDAEEILNNQELIYRIIGDFISQRKNI